MSQGPIDPIERADQYRLREATIDRIRAGHQAFFDEVKPSREQIAHGLELHYSSFVADVQGSIPSSYIGGLKGDRLASDLDRVREGFEEGLSQEEVTRRLSDGHLKRKTFESAFDPQWIEESRALYEIAGVHLATEDMSGPHENTFEAALEHIVRGNFVYERRDDLIRLANVEDIARARREGKPCILYHMAGVGCFAEADDPLAKLDLFYALGLRMAQLTYIQDNKFCCSWLQEDDTGLKPMGRDAVRRMNELGIMVDVAHCSPRSTLEIIGASEEPAMLSHTACRAIYDDAEDTTYLDAVFRQPYAQGAIRPSKPWNRNADDETMRAIAQKGGIIAFYTIDFVLGTGPESFHTWFRHLEHAIGVAGIDHVAVGADRTFFPGWPPGPMDWTNWPYWTVGLVCKGLSDEEIQKVIGGNYLRYAERVLSKKPWGEFM